MKRILPFVFLISSLYSQDKSLLQSAFQSASAEFNVPADVLRGIAFAETRWEQLEWAPGDTASCMGLPREYGVMGLRSDSWFGHSLEDAAALLKMDPEVLKKDPVHNIRGAAAYLRSLYDRLPIPEGTQRESMESWQNAVASYCGIPQQELAQQHALEIFERVSKGYNDFGIKMTPHPVDLAPLHQTMEKAWDEARLRISRLGKTAAQPDYPDAQFIPSYPDHWYTTGYARDFVVIHDMEGYYLGVISYFQQQWQPSSPNEASVHYCVNGLQDNASDRPAGDITQMVEEQYWAWHARCWNRYALGIEHEGFVSNPAWFTVEEYLASAKLTRYMALKYGIPMDRNHIIGHNQWQSADWQNWVSSVYQLTYPSFDPNCNTHTDPGQYWDWDFYMQMVKQDSTAPQVISAPPTDSLLPTQTISITFNQRMERESTELAFSITPLAVGAFSWSTDFRTLTFTPGGLAYSTTYTVSIDSGAHNYLNIGLDADKDGHGGGELYSFVVHTVQVDTTQPEVVSTYPQNNQTGVSTSAELLLQSNKPLQPASLPGTFTIRSADGLTLIDGNPAISFSSEGSGTLIRVKPQVPLAGLTAYRLVAAGQIQDLAGNNLPGFQIAFTTGADVSFPGTTINSVERAADWWQPSTSGSTTSDRVIASWTIDTTMKKEGQGSGRLDYTFTKPSDGLIRVHTPTTPSIDVGGTVFGAWVYGDNSMNTIEYWFYYYSVNASGDTVTNVSMKSGGFINWTGWKLLALPMSLIPTSTAPTRPYRRFTSFVVRQGASGRPSGTVYFDTITSGSSVTDVQEYADTPLPAHFALRQNFPNPFNPATTIEFDLPVAGPVHLSVYNTLGQQITTLIDGEMKAGIHRVDFDATRLASGLYFYRFVTRGFAQTRKMILLK